MKIKNSFVTNSSSNNYVFIFKAGSKRLDDPTIAKYIRDKYMSEYKEDKDWYTAESSKDIIPFLKENWKGGTVKELQDLFAEDLLKSLPSLIERYLEILSFGDSRDYCYGKAPDVLLLLKVINNDIEKHNKHEEKIALAWRYRKKVREVGLCYELKTDRYDTMIKLADEYKLDKGDLIYEISCEDSGEPWERVFHNAFRPGTHCYKDITIICESWH